MEEASYVCNILVAGTADCGDCAGIDYKVGVQLPVYRNCHRVIVLYTVSYCERVYNDV